MTATEVERLLVTLVGDNAQLRQTLDRSIKDFEAFGKKAEEEVGPDGKAGRAMRGFGVNARGMMMISHGALHFFGAKTAQQQMQGVNQIVMALGRNFGPMGMVAASAFGAITSQLTKVNEEVAAANKGFLSLVDGAKSFTTVLSDFRFQAMQKGMKDIVDFQSPTSLFAKHKKFLVEQSMDKFAKAGIGRSSTQLMVDDVIKQTKLQADVLNKLNADPRIKELMEQTRGEKAEADVGKMQDRLDMQRETLGLQGEALKLKQLELQLNKDNELTFLREQAIDKARNTAGLNMVDTFTQQLQDKRDMAELSKEDVKFEEQVQKLRKLGGSDVEDRIAEVRGQQKRSIQDQINDIDKLSRKTRETSGMTAGGKEAYEVSKRKFAPDAAELARLERQKDLDDAINKLGSEALSLEGKNRAFGLTGPEATRQDFLQKGGKEADEAYRRSLAAEQKGQLNELTKATDVYRQSMEGLTAAQKAAANAAKGGWSKELAYQSELLKEAAQVTEQYMLPVDKYFKEEKRLGALLEANLITRETYNRALGAAQKQLNAVANAEAQTAYGSAAAAKELYKFVQANKPVTAQTLSLGGSEAGANADLAKKQDTGNGLLEAIRKLLAKEEDKPKVDLKLGAGLL